MADLSRRKFLGQASLALAATGTAWGLISRLSPSVVSGHERRAEASPIGEPVLAHIRDFKTGEIAVMTGDREMVFQDPQLVDRILSGALRAAGG